MNISFKLNTFEGPLDLLLHLIDKNKIDIYDIPISMITDQYLEYLKNMEHHNAEVTSEFLVMAATLLDIKAKMLLPKEVDENGIEEDPRAELVEKLLQYKMYKYMSFELKDKEIHASRAMYREPTIPNEVKEYVPPIDLDQFIGDVTLLKLKNIFDDVIKRSNEKINTEALKYGRIQRDEVSIPEKIAFVNKYIHDHRQFSFRNLIEQQVSKANIIVTFLAVLELMKTGEIQARQDNNDDDIIFYVPSEEEKITKDEEQE